MYSKVVIFMCAAGIASAGNLLAAAPLTYSAAPAVSSVSFTSHPSQGPVAYSSGPSGTVRTYATYAGSPVVTKNYAAPAFQYSGPTYNAYSTPVVTKTLSPGVSYSSFSRSRPISYSDRAPDFQGYSMPTYSTYSSPSVAKTISPAVSYSSFSRSAPTYSTFGTQGPVLNTPTYASYSSPAYTSYSSPVVAKSIPSGVSYSLSQGPVRYATGSGYSAYPSPLVKTVGPAVQTYSTGPVVKTGLTYSAAPSVSHVSYSGLGSNYGW